MEENQPIFLKHLSKTDINYRLSVPSAAFTKHFPAIIHGNRVNIRVRYGNNLHEWNLPCYIRGGANIYDKPVISGDWHHIAAAKGFEEGDFLRFYKEQDHQGRFYRFQVFRSIVDEMGQQQHWVLIP